MALRFLDPRQFNGATTQEVVEALSDKLDLDTVQRSRVESLSQGKRMNFDKVWELAVIYYDAMKTLGLKKQDILSNITSGTLSLVLGAENSRNNKASDIISDRYKLDSESFSTYYGMPFTTTTVLRMELFRDREGKPLELNIQEAAKKYPFISVSDYDLIRGTKLPDKLGIEELFLLGVISASGTAEKKTTSNGNSKLNVRIHKGYEILSKVVEPIANDTFGFANPDYKESKEPRILLDSLAVTSWLEGILGIEEKRGKSIRFGLLDFKEHYAHLDHNHDLDDLAKAYLAGIVSKLGYLTIAADKTNGGNRVSELQLSAMSRKGMLKKLESLAADLGYSPGLAKQGTRLMFYPKDINPMVTDNAIDSGFKYSHAGLFVNPKHLKTLSETTKYSSYIPKDALGVNPVEN